MNRPKGLRYNKGKLRLDLITPQMTKALGKVLTKGSEKYAPRNWEYGMAWTEVLASLKRHLQAIDERTDYDPDDGLRHIDHLLTNAGFLATYYETHPELDDRPKPFLSYPRVALDIDGVLADFGKAFCGFLGMDCETQPHWHFTYQWEEKFDKIKRDKDFWLNIPPLVDGENLPFEPVCYVTHRPIPTDWTKQWLEFNDFPCEAVYTTNGSKTGILKNLVESGQVDVFIDDKWKNFVELNSVGVFTYLYDRPYNRKYSVGHMRIRDLREALPG